MPLARGHQGGDRRLQGGQRLRPQRAGAGRARRRRADRLRLPRPVGRPSGGLLQRGGGECEGGRQHDRPQRHPNGVRPGEGQGAARRPDGRPPHSAPLSGGRPAGAHHPGEPRRPAPGGRLLDGPRAGAASGGYDPRDPRLQSRGARAGSFQPGLGPHGHDPGGAPKRGPGDRHRGGNHRLRPLPRRRAAHDRASCRSGAPI